MAACFRLVEKNVTPKMNANLLREFMREERAMVLQQMSPLKAPGPDGFSAGFFFFKKKKKGATVGMRSVVLYWML
jgi:hypothetical protein